MIKYPKIESLFSRDDKTHKLIEGQWRLPEFEYLKDNIWEWTEKVDGTNIRVIWNGEAMIFRGRTDKASMPVFLYEKLQELFSVEKMRKVFCDACPEEPVCLYGEGYGAKIQKGGHNYISDGVDFVLFDVLIGKWWLKREDVEGIAGALSIGVVPIVGEGSLGDMVSLVQDGFRSRWGDFPAEGLVARPKVELKARGGRRIITKVKHRDF